ncbi:ubiquinol oxidase 4, chloroplastic/chromoplastic [Herrania umbratica]|uniref:Ubiquinol oxidase n=1 Tax=Herrania umbratica TaxID=108875 RepID=A0A6J1B806_9ROSI|nr:ubiquinol oxidase 4, chloroplastic/chromoplastic [Herrania umbratica]
MDPKTCQTKAHDDINCRKQRAATGICAHRNRLSLKASANFVHRLLPLCSLCFEVTYYFKHAGEMTTASVSSAAFATSVSSSFRARNSRTPLPSNYQNPLRCSSPPAYRPLSRKLYPVKATLLQEDEEEVVVEKSFRTKGFPGNEVKETGESPANSSSSGLERWVIKVEQSVNIFLTDSVIKILDTLYHDRDYARFFVLETIARVPYFAFISVLHMYESFGWWRRADYLKVHFAESWNEMHHLLIMEELGGNSWWFDRFLAQHIAIFYYIMTVFMYALSPRMAYHFSECVESHAFETYDKFIRAKGEELKEKPAPEVAIKYYTGGDLYLFDEFQTDRAPCSRRPKIENLYDVFVNIRDDEAEHCKTMKACQTHGNLRSPHSYPVDGFEDMPDCMIPEANCEGIVDCIKKSLTSSQVKQKEEI